MPSLSITSASHLTRLFSTGPPRSLSVPSGILTGRIDVCTEGSVSVWVEDGRAGVNSRRSGGGRSIVRAVTEVKIVGEVEESRIVSKQDEEKTWVMEEEVRSKIRKKAGCGSGRGREEGGGCAEGMIRSAEDEVC